VTLTELLLVLVIVSLLSTLAVPTVVRRQRNARISTARVDARNIAQAQETVGMLYSFYVPIQLLDNVPVTSDIEADDIGNELTQSLISLNEPVSGQIQRTIAQNSTNGLVSLLFNDWEGPFIHYQRVFHLTNNRIDITTITLDHPLDPWQNPYLFYGPDGVVGSGAGSLATSDVAPLTTDYNGTNFSNGVLTNLDDRFDRFAIVSLGPDGIRNSTILDANKPFGDDIIYFFGHVEPETVL